MDHMTILIAFRWIQQRVKYCIVVLLQPMPAIGSLGLVNRGIRIWF